MEATIVHPASPSLGARLEALHADAFAWALACCGRDPGVAEEVLQMAYVKVLSGEASFGERSTLKTWLFGVIRLTAAEERRRIGLVANRLARYARLAPAPAPPGAPSEAAPLARALSRLSGRQREVLHLVFAEEMTVEEAAEVMGIGAGSARVHYDRGKKKLRALLGAGGSR